MLVLFVKKLNARNKGDDDVGSSSDTEVLNTWDIICSHCGKKDHKKGKNLKLHGRKPTCDVCPGYQGGCKKR